MARRRLRRYLARALFFSVAATQHGCCCGEIDPIERDFDRSTPAIAQLIDRCDASPDDCVPLCKAALEDEFGQDAMYYEVTDCKVTIANGEAHAVVGYYDGSVCGRAPEALGPYVDGEHDPVVRWLAHAAFLEAASIAAFVHLAADLVRLRAPRVLVAGAIAAARDEVRHATLLRALLPAHVAVPIPCVGAYRPASLFELARSNAAEGCARETLGAALNVVQARTARDPQIRAAFASIAPDEAAHAELAWAVHAWALPQLSTSERAVVVGAQRGALAQLATLAVDRETRRTLGLPSDAELVAMAEALRTSVRRRS